MLERNARTHAGTQSRPRRKLARFAAVFIVATLAGAGALGMKAFASEGNRKLPAGLFGQSSRETLFGKVEERLPAGPYSYHSIRLNDGSQRWVVSLGKGQPAGASVKVTSVGVREGFKSNHLGRTFDTLTFGMVAEAPKTH